MKIIRLSSSLARPCLIGLMVFMLAAGCGHDMAQKNSSSSRRDINAVLADHDKELMAISGVVGVYVGLLPDGQTPCLKVMLARQTPETLRAIPKRLEGFPVVTEVTGEIRPLEKRKTSN
jgi:hypothetical protein